MGEETRRAAIPRGQRWSRTCEGGILQVPYGQRVIPHSAENDKGSESFFKNLLRIAFFRKILCLELFFQAIEILLCFFNRLFCSLNFRLLGVNSCS